MDACKNCAFYNKDAANECLMAEDLPVVCSVKLKKIKEEKRGIKNEI